MNPPYLHKVSPKKFLGQHFLKDTLIAQKIAETLPVSSYDLVLEIGPGMGVLTQFVLLQDKPVYVVEIDRESVAYLSQHFPQLHDKIIAADFLKLDLAQTFHEKKIAVIGNFPYNISSQIVFKVLENKEIVPAFAGMFQKEVAERIAAKPGSKTYGILSVLTQTYYDVHYEFTVPPHVFHPPPKVDSGVISMVLKNDIDTSVDYSFFKTVVKTAFNQRRKTLRNSLKSFDIPEKLQEDVIFAQRPEQLHYQEFIILSQRIINAKSEFLNS